MKTLSLIATAAITATAAIAVPASAGGRTSAAPAPTDTIAATQRVCVVDTPTGALAPRRVCHTRAEWASMGIDPFAK